MKRFLSVVIMLVSVYYASAQTPATKPQYGTTAPAANAYGWRGSGSAAAVQVQTTSSWQYGLPGHQLMVTNATPYFMRFSVGRPGVANDLAPSEIASTATKDKGKKRLSNFVGYDRSSNIEVPVVAMFYTDQAHTEYVGASVVKITLPGYGRTSSDSLVFRPENIWYANVANPAPSTSNTATDFTPKPLATDFDGGEGVGLCVFVWNGSAPLDIVFNGVDQGQLQKGQMYYLATREIIDIRVVTRDANGTRTWGRSFTNNNWYGVTLWELGVLSERDLR